MTATAKHSLDRVELFTRHSNSCYPNAHADGTRVFAISKNTGARSIVTLTNFKLGERVPDCSDVTLIPSAIAFSSVELRNIDTPFVSETGAIFYDKSDRNSASRDIIENSNSLNLDIVQTSCVVTQTHGIMFVLLTSQGDVYVHCERYLMFQEVIPDNPYLTSTLPEKLDTSDIGKVVKILSFSTECLVLLTDSGRVYCRCTPSDIDSLRKIHLLLIQKSEGIESPHDDLYRSLLHFQCDYEPEINVPKLCTCGEPPSENLSDVSCEKYLEIARSKRTFREIKFFDTDLGDVYNIDGNISDVFQARCASSDARKVLFVNCFNGKSYITYNTELHRNVVPLSKICKGITTVSQVKYATSGDDIYCILGTSGKVWVVAAYIFLKRLSSPPVRKECCTLYDPIRTLSPICGISNINIYQSGALVNETNSFLLCDNSGTLWFLFDVHSRKLGYVSLIPPRNHMKRTIRDTSLNVDEIHPKKSKK